MTAAAFLEQLAAVARTAELTEQAIAVRRLRRSRSFNRSGRSPFAV
jgi:hypothetical protein